MGIEIYLAKNTRSEALQLEKKLKNLSRSRSEQFISTIEKCIRVEGGWCFDE